MKQLSGSLKRDIEEALYRVRNQITWREGKAEAHLEKRKRREHLAQDATLADYHRIAASVLSNQEAQLYLFKFSRTYYPTLVAPVQNRIWLVMFGLDGVMETAFPPDDPKTHFERTSVLSCGNSGGCST